MVSATKSEPAKYSGIHIDRYPYIRIGIIVLHRSKQYKYEAEKDVEDFHLRLIEIDKIPVSRQAILYIL